MTATATGQDEDDDDSDRTTMLIQKLDSSDGSKHFFLWHDPAVVFTFHSVRTSGFSSSCFFSSSFFPSSPM